MSGSTAWIRVETQPTREERKAKQLIIMHKQQDTGSSNHGAKTGERGRQKGK